jgi:hypothetical protein
VERLIQATYRIQSKCPDDQDAVPDWNPSR